MHKEVKRIGKFMTVGTSNTLIDLGLFNLLLFAYLNPYLAASLSFLAATTNSYFWNRHWTFGEHKSNRVLRQYTQFLLTNIVGLALNNGIIYLFLNYIPLASPALTANAAKIVAIAIVVVWNYGMSRLVIFRPEA